MVSNFGVLCVRSTIPILEAHALSSFHPFAKDKTAMENILAFERVVEEFETISPSKYPDELKTATLV